MTDNIEDLIWRKASASGDHGNCVELADGHAGIVFLRNSNDTTGIMLALTRAQVAAMLECARLGMLDDLAEAA